MPRERWLCSSKNMPLKVYDFYGGKKSYCSYNKPSTKPHVKGNLGTIISHVLWIVASKEFQRKSLSENDSMIYSALPTTTKFPGNTLVRLKRVNSYINSITII